MYEQERERESLHVEGAADNWVLVGGFGYRLSVFVGTVVFARIETAAWDLLGAKLLNFFACA